MEALIYLLNLTADALEGRYLSDDAAKKADQFYHHDTVDAVVTAVARTMDDALAEKAQS